MKKGYFTAVIFLCLIAWAAFAERQMRILVYPFENQGKSEYSWIVAGMTDSVIADMGRIASVTVISDEDRKKVMKEIAFSLSDLADEKTAARVGSLTGADTIFTGSYTVAGNRVRVIAKLVSVESGSLVKSIKLDGTVEGIFDLQDKIVFTLLAESGEIKVADIKKPVVTAEERTKIETDTRPSLSAYEYFAKGLEKVHTDPVGALDLLKQALAIDPEYTEALRTAGYIAAVILNQFDLGLDYLNRAMSVMEKRKETGTVNYAALLMNMGIVYRSKGELDRAIEYYIKSKYIRDRLGLQNTMGYANLLYNLAVVNENKGKKTEAGKLYRQAYEAYSAAGYTGEWKDKARESAERLGQ
jgi:TolB-like protein